MLKLKPDPDLSDEAKALNEEIDRIMQQESYNYILEGWHDHRRGKTIQECPYASNPDDYTKAVYWYMGFDNRAFATEQNGPLENPKVVEAQDATETELVFFHMVKAL